jgi:plasmid stabilization system protein ParE
MKREVVITDRAASSYRRIIYNLKKISRIGGDAKAAILRKIRRLGTNPDMGSRQANFEKLDGVFKSVTVWDYKIYYKLEDEAVVILDIVIEKPGSQSEMQEI